MLKALMFMHSKADPSEAHEFDSEAHEFEPELPMIMTLLIMANSGSKMDKSLT
jgi:hypothetical protein